jgi:spermidine synthase
MQAVCADAGLWVQRAPPQYLGGVRLLHVDLYDHEAAAPVLDDEGFVRAGCARLLEPGGVMAVNLFGRHASFERSAQRIAAVFGADQVWSMRPTREGNTVVVGRPRRGRARARGAAGARRYHRGPLRRPGACRPASGCAWSGPWCRADAPEHRALHAGPSTSLE